MKFSKFVFGGRGEEDKNPEVTIEPTRYMATKTAALRAESDFRSEKVGTMLKKQVVTVRCPAKKDDFVPKTTILC